MTKDEYYEICRRDKMKRKTKYSTENIPQYLSRVEQIKNEDVYADVDKWVEFEKAFRISAEHNHLHP